MHFQSMKALTQKYKDTKYKIVVKKNLIDSHKNKDMGKINKNQIYVHINGMKNKEQKGKSERTKKYSFRLTSSSNFASSSFANIDFASQAHARSKGLKHPTLRSKNQILLSKIIWSRWSVYNRHLWNVMKILVVEKILFDSI